jgi:hypothetical protein
MSYHHWDEEEFEPEWNLYHISAYEPTNDIILQEAWPVYATGFQEAMDVFEILLKMSLKND